jgi:DNA ligase D-like protein (predicted ligase)
LQNAAADLTCCMVQKVAARLFFVPPMECKEVRTVEQVPSGTDWQYEIKFDGYRCLAIKQRNEVELYSRKGNPLAQFLNLHRALLAQRAKSFILDGEVVALDEQGKPSFHALQTIRSRPVDVHFYAFDLLHLDRRSLLDEPLMRRQLLLQTEFQPDAFVHFPKPLKGSIRLILEKIREFGFEGIVAKQTASLYTPGKAPGTWIKKKLKMSEEFVIGGYVRGRHGLDELVVGRYAGRRLVFVSQVGDGFVPATRRKIFDRLKGLEIAKCPFANLPEKKGFHKLDREKMGKITWVKPEVVVEIAMNEWTPDGHLRHSEFKCLRDEIPASEVPPHPGASGL